MITMGVGFGRRPFALLSQFHVDAEAKTVADHANGR